MVSVPISELAAHASRYAARVEAGEELLITRRGRPVMRICAVEAQRDDVPERLKEMERQGLVKIGTGKLPEDFWERPRPRVPGNLAIEALLADREEGR